jgi:hypothetical protein
VVVQGSGTEIELERVRSKQDVPVGLAGLDLLNLLTIISSRAACI